MILVMGLGSMGRRRIRCLQALGYKNIIGCDIREDRRKEAAKLYGIECNEFGMIPTSITTVFICLPPKYHAEQAKHFKKCPTFIEAGTEKLDYGTPSATMLFNPLVKIIQEKLPSIGKLVNITYHCGQYLPDWHPYEKVSDFYAGEVGVIEMVAFELMWFTKLFGFHRFSALVRDETSIEGLKAPDSVAFVIELCRNAHATIMIDVVSRTPIRQLVINGTEKQLRYDLNQGVSEQMYIDETKAFMDGNYPNTLEHSNMIIKITKQICP